MFGAALAPSVSAGTLTLIRWWIACAVLWPLARREGADRRAVRRHLEGLVFLALTGIWGYSYALYGALHYTTPVNASLIAGANPAVIAVLEALWRRTRISWRQAAGLALSFAGVGLVVCRGDWRVLAGLRLNAGDLLMFLCVLLWSVYSLSVPRIQREVGTMTTAWLTSLFGGLAGIVPAWLDWHLVPSAGTWLGIAYIGVCASVLSYVCWNEGVMRLQAGRAGIFLNLLPVFTMILTALTGRPVGAVQWTGGVLVVAGVTLTLTEGRPGERTPATAPGDRVRNQRVRDPRP